MPFVEVPIEVVDNAVDVASFDAPARVRTGPVRILYAGTIGRGKGLLELLDALVALRAQGVDGWTVLLAGPPNALEHEDADAVAARYRAAGFGSALLGPKAPAELPALMAGADVFVLPSRSEGQPIAVLEAMASGLAIVTSRVGANPDVIRHGIDGLLVDPGDAHSLARALRALIEDADLRARLGTSARRRAEERFDAERLAEALAEVWTSLTRVRPSGGARRRPTATPRGGPVGRPTRA
jgi:glycosyltransferase involved in cell wall biosynthesis